MFNLSSLQAAEHAEIEILHPVTRKATGMKITIAGPASQEYALAKQRMVSARKELEKQDAEAANLEFLAVCIVSWSGISMDGKVELPFSKENVKKILSDPKFYWLEQQIDSALVDKANFIGA